MNHALQIDNSSLFTGPNTITFGPEGTLNGVHVSGQVFGPDTILAPQTELFTSQVPAVWNMVSVPLLVNDFHRSVLYPTANSDAFAYTGTYSPTTILQNGVAYWLKFPFDTLCAFRGSLVDVETVAVRAGWNMIGSTSSTFPTSEIEPIGTEIQSQFFGYNNGYHLTTDLEPGSGYWVKVSQAGALVLGSSLKLSPK